MKAVFVNEDGGVRYAEAIVRGYKPIETRNRDMLRSLVGERVAIVRTHRLKSPMVVGYVTITGKQYCSRFWLADNRDKTLIPPGSKRDNNGHGKWGYTLADPEPCDPFPLPADAKRHGRSWCEF